MYKMLLAATALLTMTACADKAGDTGPADDTNAAGETDAPGESGLDTAYYEGGVSIDTAGGDCDKKGWFYDVVTVGLSSGADLYIYQTGSSSPWSEDHPIPVYDSSAYGYWTDLYLTLGYVSSTTDVVSGSTTLFSCDTARVDTLTWLVDVYDDAGVYADCVTWGDDTSYYSMLCTNAL